MYDKSPQGAADHARRLIASQGDVPGRPDGVAPRPPRNRTESAVDALKRYIIENELNPGDALPTEARLCEILDVSRTSVREALRRLEALDIVSSQQGRGSFVGPMSLQPMVETAVLRHAVGAKAGTTALREVARTRQYLDLGMAEELVRAMRGTTNPELRHLVEEMTDRARAGRSYMDADIAFHQGLVAHLDNALVGQLVEAMWLIHQAVIPRLGKQMPGALLVTAHTHGAILDALEAGDIEAFRAAVDAHYAPLAQLIDTEEGGGQR